MAVINLATYKHGDGSSHPLVAKDMDCMQSFVVKGSIVQRQDITTFINLLQLLSNADQEKSILMTYFITSNTFWINSHCGITNFGMHN